MEKNSISANQYTSFLKLNSVDVKFSKKSGICFKIVPSANQMGLSMVDEHQKYAEIKNAGTDHFAIFETVLGKVTYVFCADRMGYKIGPGTAQKTFVWK